MTILGLIRNLLTFPKNPAPQVIASDGDLAQLADTIFYEVDLRKDANPNTFEEDVARPLMEALAFPVISNTAYAEKTEWPLDVIALELSWWRSWNPA